ncbi:hypothetical protein OG440_38870 (plasmid) [Streptomyces sp. NBC_00637]
MAMDWGRHFGGKPDSAKVTPDRTETTRTEARKAVGRIGALSSIGKRKAG